MLVDLKCPGRIKIKQLEVQIQKIVLRIFIISKMIFSSDWFLLSGQIIRIECDLFEEKIVYTYINQKTY